MVYTRIVQPGQRKKYAYEPGESLLLRVSGTVIPEVWWMVSITLLMTWIFCLVYDPLRRGYKANTLMNWERFLLNIFEDMDKLLGYLTGFVTFILGFFNSTVYYRWWKMRELCGNIVEASQNCSMQMAAFFVKPPRGLDARAAEAALSDARRDLVRLLGLAQALALQACHRVRDHSWLIEKELMDRDGVEHVALQQIPGPGYNEVYGWYITKMHKYADQGMIDTRVEGSVNYMQTWHLCTASNNAEDLMMHLNQPVPLAYCHLLEFMVTLYVFIMPFALVHKLLWIAIPIAPVVTLFFYGFFKLGFSMLMDPFQQDAGFDTNAFVTSNMLTCASLERNVPLARAMGEVPEGDMPSLTSAFEKQSAGTRMTRRRASAPVGLVDHSESGLPSQKWTLQGLVAH